ncbi:hypothetical protein Csa_006957 [Cucumis sativus]|uniref:Uncharacterized protein n=1 Tax=Cucumis sativus TaxID=3659 RepID=A0A0A0M384_CUCSA|nr:hypothetical protein Csa_006957 [Cucumis sativus]
MHATSSSSTLHQRKTLVAVSPHLSVSHSAGPSLSSALVVESSLFVDHVPSSPPLLKPLSGAKCYPSKEAASRADSLLRPSRL